MHLSDREIVIGLLVAIDLGVVLGGLVAWIVLTKTFTTCRYAVSWMGSRRERRAE